MSARKSSAGSAPSSNRQFVLVRRDIAGQRQPVARQLLRGCRIEDHRDTQLRPSRSVASTVSSGISICTSTASARSIRPRARSTCAGVTRAFAAGTTMIWFSPPATVIEAVPLAHHRARGRARGRCLSALSPASSCPPKTSWPIAPTSATSAPSRADATAWLAPLPPGTVRKRFTENGFARADKTTRLGHQIHVDAADDDDPRHVCLRSGVARATGMKAYLFRVAARACPSGGGTAAEHGTGVS